VKIIDHLNKDHLTKWRQICRFKWLYENTDSDDPTATKLRVYDEHIRFLEGCIDEYDIDPTKEFVISEITGSIYYLDEDE
jgi:lipocalin